MTTQSQLEPPEFSIEELGAKFGAQLGWTHAKIITLEKQLTVQALVIQKMTKNEERQQSLIQGLEADQNDLKSKCFELEEVESETLLLVDALKVNEAELGTKIQNLEAELNTARSENSALKNQQSEWKKEYGSEIDGIIKVSNPPHSGKGRHGI